MLRIFLDCETGGTDPHKQSLMTAYFGIYDNDYNLIDELDLKLKPDNGELIADDEALKVTGLNIEAHLADPQTITYSEGRAKLIALLNKHKIKGKKKHYRPCGQNVQFDLNFIHAQLIDRETWEKTVHYNPLDTLRILTFLQDVGFLPKDLGSLSSMAQYFDIQVNNAHNAKADVKMTVEVYKMMRNMLLTTKKNHGIVGTNQLLDIIEV